MGAHDQGRQLPRRGSIVLIARGVVECVGRQPLRVGELYGFRFRDIARVDGRLRCAFQHLFGTRGRVPQAEPGRLRTGGPDQSEPAAEGLGQPGVRERRWQSLQAGFGDNGKPPYAALDHPADKASVGQKSETPHPELPQGQAELRLPGTHGLPRAVAPTVQVPPASGIVDEVERPVRRPFRLEDGDVGAAGDPMRIGQGAIRRDVGHP